jgi:uncharacterized protein YggE
VNCEFESGRPWLSDAAKGLQARAADPAAEPPVAIWRQNPYMSRILPLVAVLALSSVPAFAQPAPQPPDSVAANGEGVIQAVPDRAWIVIGAESRAASPKEAQRQNAEAMAPVQQKLRAAGIPADAIRTVGYDIEYEWDYVNNRRVGKGYVARNTIEVRVDAIERIGDYLEIAVGSGATNVGGIRFDLKDRSKLERDALRLAVVDARAKAEAAAAGAGRTIDRIIRIDEHGAVTTPLQTFARPMARQVAADAAPPISAGQIEIRASATVTATLR